MANQSNASDDDALDLERALSTREVAKLLGLAPITLQQLRARGQGPAYFRVGRRSIRYRCGDVIAYRNANTARPRGGAR
ncbi:MAG TPA: helix-turn-helix domain-containing protein [Kofleriaceae bacterium]|jgi:predicted DNA-binding transcriptional regulator AlpA